MGAVAKLLTRDNSSHRIDIGAALPQTVLKVRKLPAALGGRDDGHGNLHSAASASPDSKYDANSPHGGAPAFIDLVAHPPPTSFVVAVARPPDPLTTHHHTAPTPDDDDDDEREHSVSAATRSTPVAASASASGSVGLSLLDRTKRRDWNDRGPLSPNTLDF